MTVKKLILVLGATGAQGLAVIDALLAPAKDGSPSPYAVRALTRDINSRRAKGLASKGVDVVEGSTNDLDSVRSAFQGAHGAWVNTDGFTVGEQKEIYQGMKIYEIAKQTPSIRHYIWSNLDYSLKLGGYDPKYKCEHYDGKGRVGEWLQMQPSDASEDGFVWSQVTTGPYMDMLNIFMFGPINVRADGTYVFATPVGQGHVQMIALEDLGYFARWSFDNRDKVSGRDLQVASDTVGWDYLVKTFTKVTGKPAVVVHQPFEEWADNFDGTDNPVRNELIGKEEAKGATTWRGNFAGFWAQWRDDTIQRDLQWVRSIHPGLLDLEGWMRKVGYTGVRDRLLLKNGEDGKALAIRSDRVSKL